MTFFPESDHYFFTGLCGQEEEMRMRGGQEEKMFLQGQHSQSDMSNGLQGKTLCSNVRCKRINQERESNFCSQIVVMICAGVWKLTSNVGRAL